MNCPTNDDLERWALGFSDDPRAMQSHVDSCDVCGAKAKALRGDHAAIERAAKGVKLPKVGARRRWWMPASGLAAALLIGIVIVSMSRSKPEESLLQGIGQAADEKSRVPRSGPQGTYDYFAYASRSDYRGADVDGKRLMDGDPVGGATRPAPQPPPAPPKTAPPKTEELALLTQAENRAKLGDLSGAMHDFDRALKNNPNNAQALKRRAELRRRQGDKAGADADEAMAGKLGFRPGNPEADLPETPPDMTFDRIVPNPELDTAKETTSTFGLDVDTASYTLVRKYLQDGHLPPADAVRVEEFVNYFRYLDDSPPSGHFAFRLEAAPSPFTKDRHLLRISIRAKEIKPKERKDINLSLVIDVSGSMREGSRLETVKQALHYLVDHLRPADRVGIVLFSTNARKVLDPTPVSSKDKILAVIDELQPENSTNTESGLKLGYEMAAAAFDSAKSNRVVLCTDGVANAGVTDPTAIAEQHKPEAAKGIYLTCVGVGMHNFNNSFLEKLALGSQGNYAYFDTFEEAKKAFGERLIGTMEVVAEDARVQVEFDKDTVAGFRLIGYENRVMANADFRNDKADAGEVGPNQQVTALYEFTRKTEAKGRVVTVKVRFKEPGTKEWIEEQQSIGHPQVLGSLKDASAQYHLAAGAAGFAEVLRGTAKGYGLDAVLEQASAAAAAMDKPADAKELVELIKIAKKLGK